MKRVSLLLFVVVFAIAGLNAQAVVLSENFSNIMDSTGSPITNSLDLYTQMPGWSGGWVYPSNGKVKIGKSAEAGFLQTPALNLSACNGQFMVTFDAKAWANDATSLIIDVNGSPYTVDGLTSTAFNTFSIPLSGGTSTTTVKFQSYQDNRGRFFLDNVIISQMFVDTVAPQLNSVTASANSLIVAFNEILDPITAENINNYTLDHNITVISATMTGSNKVTLFVSPALIDGTTYTLQVNNIADTAGNIMQPNTISFTYSNSVWDGTYAPWIHGTGTEADPFLIENAQQLAYLANRVNNGLDAAGGHVSNHNLHYKLMTDVNLNGSESFQWTPIGYWISETNYYSFGGHFDGNNHTISGIYINSSANRVGFFGYTVEAEIKNLSISGDMITTTDLYAGGIVGYAYNSNIVACNNTCNLNSTNHTTSASCAGGVVGFIGGESNFIINCYNNGNISSSDLNSTAGGLVGMTFYNTMLTIINCYNKGGVSALGNYSGGATNVSAGGIAGRILGNAFISNCYNVGQVTSSTTHAGGIVGYTYPSSFVSSYCYYLENCGGNNTCGGSPMSSSAMQTADFVDILNNGSCAWEQDVTPYVNDRYPILTMIMDSAYTEPATNMTAVSALLHGSVNVEHATIISKGFEYRVQGDSTFTPIIVTGDSNAFSYLLSGLTPNTIYEYRTFVNIAACPYTSFGSLQSFEVSWLNADTILIYDADMLQWVADRCNSGSTFYGKYIKLMNNIVLPLNQPNNMTSIGRYPNYPFGGTFDGNGMTITNLYIDQPNTEYQGFFGYTLSANLYEVGLVNITASGRNYTGGMVAYAENTYMRDCYVNGGSLFALSYCGGLVGYQDEGTNSIISGCYNTCSVSGNHYVGGLVGFSNYSTVRNSYVAASVTGQGNGIGAIIGGANEVLMYHCYFNDSITGQTSAIGENNFKDNEGMTTAQMQDPVFVATLNQGLVVPVWKSDYAVPINNGFPILIWQYPGAEPCDAPGNLSASVSGNSAALSWNGGENASYYIVEYGTSGSDVHSENTSNHQLVISNLQDGNYFWRVKSVCSFGESNFVNGNTIAVGIDDYNLAASMTVYPNPTTGIVNVQCTMNNVQAGTMEFQLFDAFGRLLRSTDGVETRHGTSLQADTHGSSTQTQIDLSRFAPGVYLIKAVADGNVVAVRKVVKR